MPAPYISDTTDVVWTLPLPSTTMVSSPSLQKLPRRELALSFALQEEEDSEPRSFVIAYSGVASFKWTYLNSCTEGMIHAAYDKLIDCGSTEWLKECQEISSRVDSPKDLHHYRIFFDEGPCFEVVGESVAVTQLGV